MSASQVSAIEVPEHHHTESYHYKLLDLTPQKDPEEETHPMKSDSISTPVNEAVPPDLGPVKPEKNASVKVEENVLLQLEKMTLVQAEEKTPIKPDEEVELGRSDFLFLTTLGTGTFSRVWLVRPTREVQHSINKISTSQVYALKVLRKADVIRLKQCEHTKSERRIISACRKHPFIAHLLYSWRDWNSLYLLMEYAAGGELFSYLRRDGRFSIATTQFYSAEITSALVFLHQNDVVYRDLKPENVMIDAHGHVCLVDFGFSKKIGTRETYTICGTPDYMAPEIILSKGHGKAVDWWALGIFIYELACGYPPFFHHCHPGLYNMILTEKIHFPSSLDLPESLKDIVRKLCKKDATKRLGNQKRGGKSVKEHPFFSSINWDELLEKTLPGPLAPHLEHPEDTSNFQSYAAPKERDDNDYTLSMYDEYERFFEDF